jgi:hypothetical protein
MGSSLLLLVVLFFGGVLGAPRVRQSAPDFSAAAVLPDLSFGTVSLASLTANQHWTVLLFFPAGLDVCLPNRADCFFRGQRQFCCAQRVAQLRVRGHEAQFAGMAAAAAPRGRLGPGLSCPFDLRCHAPNMPRVRCAG